MLSVIITCLITFTSTLCFFFFVLWIWIIVISLTFSQENFNIPCKAGLLATNFLSFCFSGNVFILPSFLKGSFAGYKILSWLFLALNSLNISSHCLLVSTTSDKKSAVDLIRVPFCVMSFPLTASRFSCYFGFSTFSLHCIWLCFSALNLLGLPWMCRKWFSTNLKNFQPLFLRIFLFLFSLLSFWNSYYVYIDVL